MFKKLFSSPILNSWLSNFVLLFSSLIAIPIVITKLSTEEANVWFLFFSIIAFSQGVLFGFNGTFSRFVAYSSTGIRINEFSNIIHKVNIGFLEDINKAELSRIIALMRKIYLFLGFLFFIFLLIVGYFSLSQPIGYLVLPNTGWMAWGVIVVSTTLILILGYFRVFLEGNNQVALVQRTIALVNLFGLLFILAVLLGEPSLFSIVLVYQTVAVSAAVILTILSIKRMNQLGLKLGKNDFDAELFKIVWDSAWKSGITTVIANTVKHVSSILVAQWFSPSQSASFQFTKRLFDVIETFTMTTFQARIPLIASIRGRGDFDRLIPLIKQTQWLSYIVFLTGYSLLLFLNEDVLKLIDSNVSLGSVELIMLFSLATFFSRWGGMTLLISNQSNYVVEHINAIIVGITFFTTLYFFYNLVGIEIFPLALLVALLVSMPVISKQVYPTIKTSFWKYEKSVLVPFFGVLILINLTFYWMSL